MGNRGSRATALPIPAAGSYTRPLMSDERRERALALWQEGADSLLSGDLDEAIDLFTRSLDVEETAEGYTFRGWAYSFQGRLDEAILECQRAIEVDPEFGNPYNDIGAYLIEQGKHDEAIPWLERALRAGRYDSYHFPWFNLGRAYAAMDCYGRALECFREALALAPDYAPATDAMRSARLKIH